MFPVHFCYSEYLAEFVYTFILLTLLDDSFSTANLCLISTTNANSVCWPMTTNKCICNSVMNYRLNKDRKKEKKKERKYKEAELKICIFH